MIVCLFTCGDFNIMQQVSTASCYTRQMMIIAGGDLSCVVGGMLSERVGSMHARMHYVCVSVQNAVCTCCTCVGKREKGFV